jgi:tetratricopeptide (TPR) repeat protein
MARAAAKRRPPAHRHETGRKHKDAGGQRFEDTLFFNRLRLHAKWVFVFLIVVFGLGFVLLGVGSGSLGLGDIFSGVNGGGGGNAVKKALKATEKNPKDAAAWKTLALGYDSNQDFTSAVPAWETYTQLKPRDPAGFQSLAQDYGQLQQAQYTDLQSAAAAVQQAQPSSLGPPTSSPLGRALGSLGNPIDQSQSTTLNSAYQDALNTFQQTSSQLLATFQKLAKLEPTEPSVRLQVAQAAEALGDTATAIAAYRQFIKLAPDDASVPQAKAKIKALEKQSQG